MNLYGCYSNGPVKAKAATVLLFLMGSVYAQTQSCSPTSCSTICNPTCSSNQKCVLKTMTECGVCPKAVCLNTGTVDTPTETASPSSSSNDTGPIVGGIVGGLVGLGIIIGIAVYCYFKRNKKLRGKLPLAFTSTSNMHSRTIVQENTRTSVAPHPAVLAALAHHNEREQSTHPLSEFNVTMQPPQLPPVVEDDDDDEFEKRIALQNKRISEILMTNPRLSYNNRSSSVLDKNSKRISSAYYTTEDESDMDDSRSVSTMNSAAVVRTATPQSSVAVVQVVRAKAQIMRVNSVRSAVGLSRNDSVRTVLTPQAREEVYDDDDDDELPEFPTTPNNASMITERENPFNDSHSFHTATTR